MKIIDSLNFKIQVYVFCIVHIMLVYHCSALVSQFVKSGLLFQHNKCIPNCDHKIKLGFAG